MKKMKYAKIIFIVFALFPFYLSAETAEEQGLRIAKASYENGRGFTDMVSDQLMILIDPKGNEVTREVSGKTLENLDPNDGDKSLTYFKTPKDVEGTVMLSHTHISDDDDQWLYLPALGRVKRISSSNKSGAFMGSEVAFEDFSGTDYRKYEWKFLGEEMENNIVSVANDPINPIIVKSKDEKKDEKIEILSNVDFSKDLIIKKV